MTYSIYPSLLSVMHKLHAYTIFRNDLQNTGDTDHKAFSSSKETTQLHFCACNLTVIIPI